MKHVTLVVTLVATVIALSVAATGSSINAAEPINPKAVAIKLPDQPDGALPTAFQSGLNARVVRIVSAPLR